MTQRAMRLKELGRVAGVELDEALVTLWDAGIDYVDGGNDLVKSRDIRAAQTALGLNADRAELTVEYWREQANAAGIDFDQKLAELGVRISAHARKIPKGSLRKLRSAFGQQLTTVTATFKVVVKPAQPPLEPLVWTTVGTVGDVAYLDEDELRSVHEALSRDFATTSDPVEPPGIRDVGLLSSASHRPRTAFGDVLKYPTPEMAGAALFHSLTLNHAFHNGNKRTALVALIAFLDRQDIVLTCSQEELFRLTLKVAQHGLVPLRADSLADREVLEIARWIRSNSRRVERGERPMKWMRLKQRLREFDCGMTLATGVGNRLNITRVVTKSGFLRNRRITLRTQVACSGEGAEADRDVIHKIRRDLQLDDEHHIDSATFYGGTPIDSFIADYRRILRRLAKL